MNNNTYKVTSLGFTELLTLIFVVAKILAFVTWNWWLVFSPILIKVMFGLLYGFIEGIANVDE